MNPAPATLASLLPGIPLPAALAARVCTGVHFDSRRILPGHLFFAFSGANVDGRQFAATALAQGAAAVVSDLPPLPGLEEVWVQVPHPRRLLALLARHFAGDPTLERLPLFGVTGTNGKTTTTWLVAAILAAAGLHTGLFGTIEYRLGAQRLPSINTTPESVDLYALFADLLAPGLPAAAALEVSSHALALGRVWGFHFAAAIFTNLTRDHLDFHGDMESYFAAKCELFRGQDAPPPAVAAINFDNPYGPRVPVAPTSRLIRFGLHAQHLDLRAANLHCSFDGIRFDLITPTATVPVASPMLGEVNAVNILSAIAATWGHGLPLDAILAGIAACPGVPGRFERVDAGQPFLVIVDYSHTDDALRNAIRVARTLNPFRVITLFGCGGDRDRSKRPLMGMAAAEASDYVVLTSDNPRTEDPLAILNDALVGLRRFDTPHHIEPDREKAIRHALAQAGPRDLVLLAGKGHEDYQIIGKTKHPFDDRLVARRALAALGYEQEQPA